MHLINEMARLGACFTFLRRSFYRDTERFTFAEALASIKDAFAVAHARTETQIEADRQSMI